MTAASSAGAPLLTTGGAGQEPTPGTRRTHVPGEVGIWIFILGDMVVFAAMFCLYLFYRGREAALFEQSQQTLVQGFGVTNTLVLLVSSLFVVYGMRAMKLGRSDVGPWMFVGAIGCGVVFTAIKYIEWSAKITEGLTPATNNFYMLYYLLTGLHFLHLVVGMGVLMFLARTARLPKLSATRFAVAEGGACFWHMVDLLWIVIFPLLYLLH
jgi:nitric oxide reductase NorE protein